MTAGPHVLAYLFCLGLTLAVTDSVLIWQLSISPELRILPSLPGVLGRRTAAPGSPRTGPGTTGDHEDGWNGREDFSAAEGVKLRPSGVSNFPIL